MLSDDNYLLVLKIVGSRYSNSRIILKNHFNQLWEMVLFNDGKFIRQALNRITESTDPIKILSYAIEKWDPILL